MRHNFVYELHVPEPFVGCVNDMVLLGAIKGELLFSLFFDGKEPKRVGVKACKFNSIIRDPYLWRSFHSCRIDHVKT